MAQENKICQFCGVKGHSKFYCKARLAKPIQKYGKQAKEWARVRAKWFRDNPADQYICYLCGRVLSISETTLDHVIPRSNAKNYSNRHDQSNLQPCCWSCNSQKGSSHA